MISAANLDHAAALEAELVADRIGMTDGDDWSGRLEKGTQYWHSWCRDARAGVQ